MIIPEHDGSKTPRPSPDGKRPPAAGANGTHPNVRALAALKKLPADFLLALGVHDGPAGKVLVSYLDDAGELVYVRERRPAGSKQRFYTPAGTESRAYGQWKLGEARKRGEVFICEGESDTWVLWHHKFPALGFAGAGTVGRLTAEDLAGIDDVVLVPDADAGGDQFAAGLLARLKALGFTGRIRRVRLPAGTKDVSDLHCADPTAFPAAFAALVEKAQCLKVMGGAYPGEPKDSGPAVSDKEVERKNEKKEKRPSQSKVLIGMAEPLEKFHDGTGRAFVVVPRGGAEHVLPVRGGLAGWLQGEYYRATEEGANAGAINDALNTIEAQALYENAKENVYVRLAPIFGGRGIALDLGGEDGRAVEVTGEGWSITDRPRARLWRPAGLLPLPSPVRGGALTELWPLLNVREDDRVLVAAWLLGCLAPRGPYCALNLLGEQGSAKSTAARLLRTIIDANASPLRRPPREDDDLIIAATNALVVAMDNVSHIDPALSDSLCRILTGGGIGKRKLYSDSTEVIVDVCRPVLVTSIPDVAGAPDLADRSLSVVLPAIDPARRLTEAELWDRFEAARPRLLGALLTAASAAFRSLPTASREGLSRMADAHLWVRAGEDALGFPRGTFDCRLQTLRSDAALASAENCSVYPALERLLQTGPWCGTCQELLSRLERNADPAERSRRTWPGSPRALSGLLRRSAPALRSVGIGVSLDERDTGSNRTRIVRVERLDDQPSGPSGPSGAVPEDPIPE